MESMCARPPGATRHQTIMTALSGFGAWLSQATELPHSGLRTGKNTRSAVEGSTFCFSLLLDNWGLL
jgi:hypothetical protein